MRDKEKLQKDSATAASESKNQKALAAGASKTTDDLIIVGIGASAGGLDALQRVLPGLPTKSGMAYIIVQHLAPKHRSLLSSLLAKHTKMPVETIKDGMLVRPDTIYITPPNKDVTLSRNRLKLSAASNIGPRPSIDYFFNSLAEEKRAHAVGIILSGTGTDGAHGIRAIKSNDGITMAQIAESAKFDGMPQAAISTGLVDLILPPENIGQEIENALKYPNLIAKAPLDMHASEIGAILDMLLQQTGVDFRDYKQTTIHRRISRRMVIHKIDNLQDYVAYIKNRPEEILALQKDLLISVTSFFRDSQAFEALARSLRELFEHKQPGDSFRAWVPGCSTGEEAYTIAILVAEILGHDLGKYRIQIFATDIDEDSIQLARKGIYPVATVMETDGRRFEKHFSHRDNTVTVKKHIRDMVVLAKQDLIKDTPFLHLDLISCRNLMIYINSELQDKLLSLFQFSLNSDGLLFLGKSESINKRMDLFKAVDNRWKIFRRKESSAGRLPKLMQSRHTAQLASHRTNLKKQQQTGAGREALFFDALLGLLDCCAVLTDENANILYIRGNVSPYFRFPQGLIRESLNALDMARPEIRFVLQSMLHKSVKEDRTFTSNRIALDESGTGVQIKIGPMQKTASAGQRLIVFAPAEVPKAPTHRKYSPEEADHERIRELEQELEVTREHLQDTIEELETSSEELQSLNEELQSANEELQASNEELETSNEELQASNEELNTVNDELRAKSQEAQELLSDLKTSEKRYRLLVDNMNEAIMVCELEHGRKGRPTDLIIKQANRALEQLISVNSRELPMRAGSAHLHELVTEEMLASFMDIAQGGRPQRIEVSLSALGKDLTISVYNLDTSRLGIVCRDDTERRRAEEALKMREARYRELVQNANSAIIRWKIDGKLTFFNEYARQFFGYEADEVIGKDVRILLPERDSSGHDPTRLVQDIVAHPDRFVNNVNENVCRDGRRVWMTWTNRPILDANGQLSEILAVGTDITEQKRNEQTLSRQRELLEGIFDHIPVLLVIWDPHRERFTLNRYAEQVLGWTTNQANEGDFMSKVYPDANCREQVAAYIQSPEAGWHEEICTKADGTEVPIDWANIRLSDEKRIGIGVDLRERKQSEETLREINQELNDYAYALTHNLKAPFRAVENYANFLLEDLADILEDAPKQYLEGIKKAISQANQQFKDLEVLYSIKIHPLDFEPFEMSELISEIAYLFNKNRGQKLIAADHWPTLNGNLHLIRQILINLISNGFRYNCADLKQVEVGWQTAEDNGFEIFVRDNGIGIDPQFHKKIFKIFARLHTEGEYEGTGIGLAIVNRAAQKLNGKLRVESEPGKGSTFYVKLPKTIVKFGAA